jgi:ankyrin repeat protein
MTIFKKAYNNFAQSYKHNTQWRLHNAVKTGQINKVEKLIEKGADVNAPVPESDKTLPLDIAMAKNNHDMVSVWGFTKTA